MSSTAAPGHAVGVLLARKVDGELVTGVGTKGAFFTRCFGKLDDKPNMSSGKDITRECISGAVFSHKRGAKSVLDHEIEISFHGLDFEFLSLLSGAAQVMHSAEAVGVAPGANDTFDAVLVVWLEAVPASGCSVPNGQHFVQVYDLANASVVTDGDPGSADYVTQIKGYATAADYGKGPVPLALSATGTAEWLSDDIPNSIAPRFLGGPPPAIPGASDCESGVFDLEVAPA